MNINYNKDLILPLHLPHLIYTKLLTTDEFGPDEDLTGVDVEEEEARNDLQNMLAKARKLKLKKERKNVAEVKTLQILSINRIK